jgi:hypothetical protein
MSWYFRQFGGPVRHPWIRSLATGAVAAGAVVLVGGPDVESRALGCLVGVTLALRLALYVYHPPSTSIGTRQAGYGLVCFALAALSVPLAVASVISPTNALVAGALMTGIGLRERGRANAGRGST